MLNIGVRPTLSGQKTSIEVHLFDFNKNLYTKQITLFFIDKLRDEKKFNSLNDLKYQLLNDKNKTIDLLR